MRMPIPWVFVLAYLAGIGLQLLIPLQVSSSAMSLSAQVAGGVLFTVGAGLAVWSLLIFRRAAAKTVPGEASVGLVTAGPYRLSRNPIYAGLILAYLGEAGLLVQLWPLLFLPLAVVYVNWFVIPVEEAALRGLDGYAQY